MIITPPDSAPEPPPVPPSFRPIHSSALPEATAAAPVGVAAPPATVDWEKQADALLASLPRVPWARLGRLVLAGNPFYLLSAVLMLYGLYLVSVDPQMFGQELSQLAFNFSSLELYEVLLVVTALLLARRAVWYDATLLVLLENLLVLVPFLLLSQASFLTAPAAWAVGGTAVALAVGKFWVLRRHMQNLNFPTTLLAVGCALLVVNVAFPLTFHHVVQLDNELWPSLSRSAWLWFLPGLIALANFHPQTGQRDGRPLEQPWTPLLFHTLWLAGTAVHLHSVNYLDGQKFQLALVAPAVWTLAWTGWNRASDFAAASGPGFHRTLLVLPALAPLLAAGRSEPEVLFTLASLNVLAYFALGWWRKNPLATQLGLASLVLLAPAMPESLGRVMIPDFSAGKALALALAGYALLLLSASRRPGHALLGAVIVGLGTQFQFSQLDYVEQFAMQHALIFLLLHSLRWTEEHASRALRAAAALAWLAHSVVWLRLVETDANWPVLLGGCLVLGVAALVRLAHGQWSHWFLTVNAGLVSLAVPVNMVVELLRITPSGYLAVLGSFVLFAVGTALAWTKPRWNQPAPAPVPASAT